MILSSRVEKWRTERIVFLPDYGMESGKISETYDGAFTGGVTG